MPLLTDCEKNRSRKPDNSDWVPLEQIVSPFLRSFGQIFSSTKIDSHATLHLRSVESDAVELQDSYVVGSVGRISEVSDYSLPK